MSQDSFTEISQQSWFSRLGGALKGILVGVLFVALAGAALFWNEGRAVKRYKTLKEGAGAVVSVRADAVDPSHEGKLVHVSGTAVSPHVLEDYAFGVSAKALKLRRSVEMYQWDERTESKTEKKLGGGTETVEVVSYEKGWSSSLIKSANFKHPKGHENPSALRVESQTLTAKPISLGAFTLSDSLAARLQGYEPLAVPEDRALPSDAGTIQSHDGGYFVGNDPANPMVGDLRISFAVVKQPLDISLVSKQVQQSFEPYRSRAGGSLELLQNGLASADEMFQKARDDNKLLTWIIRGLGGLFMFFGFTLIFRVLSVLADVVPLFGRIVGAGTMLISFLLASSLSLTTMAIAWVVYRPLIGIGLLVGAVALMVGLGGKLRKPKAVS